MQNAYRRLHRKGSIQYLLFNSVNDQSNLILLAPSPKLYLYLAL